MKACKLNIYIEMEPKGINKCSTENMVNKAIKNKNVYNNDAAISYIIYLDYAKI